MSKENTYRCSICKFEFPFGKIMYSQDGKRIICRDCNRLSTKKVSLKLDSNINKVKSEVKESDIKEGIKIICRDCRYRFIFGKIGRKRPICPYCGKSNLMRNEGNAQNLIDEVSKNPGLYV